ncbi:RNA-directed DNA polymerase, eukaryota, reverse transcriptase zinc-binding domain protein [Tanacetum coccineum]
MLVSNEPWVVLGDFNVIMNTDECSNSFNIVDRDMDVFRKVLHSLELEDIVSYAVLPEFLPTIKDNWYSEVHGFHMFVLAKRLRNMKKHMRNMNRLNGNVFDKVKVLREELKRVQNCLDKDPNCVHLREEKYVFCNAYKEAARDEEMVLRQKTKIQWLKDGDQNSAYFHNSLKGRMFRSRIEVVYDSEGQKYDDESYVEQICSPKVSCFG